MKQRTSEIVKNLLNEEKAYRVVTDEPQGICVGFKPTGVESDEYNLVKDDGGNTVTIHGKDLIISNLRGLNSEPQDLFVWRSEKEFAQWYRENMEGEPEE